MKPQTLFHLFSCAVLLAGYKAAAQDTRAFNQNASRSNHSRSSLTQPQDGLVFHASGAQAKATQKGAGGSFLPSGTIGYFQSRWGATLEAGSFNPDPGFDLDSYTSGIHDFTRTGLRASKASWFVALGPVYRQPLPANLQLQAGVAAGMQKNAFAEFSVSDIQSGQLIADYNNSQKTDTRNKPSQLLIKPTIRLEWFPSKSFIGVHLFASGLINPSEQSVAVRYRDLSRVNYDLPQQEVRMQVMNAPIQERTITTPKTTMTFGAGISLRLPSGKKNPAKNNNGCGPVTQKITHPDGRIEEHSFGCAEDAARYQQTQDSASNPSRRMAPSQNNNTVRSNRGEFKSMLILADTDEDGVYETDLSTEITDEINVDETGKITPSQKAGISTSRSNVRTRQGIKPVGNGLYTGEGTIEFNGKTIPFQAIYKSRHETAKNAIGNIR